MSWHNGPQQQQQRLSLQRLMPILYFTVSSLTRCEALFIRPPATTVPYPLLKLATADLLRVPYKGIAYDSSESASYSTFALSLNAEFGPLDVVTFLGLQEMYGSWSETKSRVKWIEGEPYTLLDFLPPLLQAVNGLYFQSSKLPTTLPSFVGSDADEIEEEKEQQVLLTTNCWGFAWEVLYQADNKDVFNMQISTADPTSAWRAFTGPGFYLVQSSRTNPKLLRDEVLRNKRLKGGDTLLIWHQIPGQSLYLDHVAILLDNDVYYEKSGSGDQVPFRITTWEGIIANFPIGIFDWEWRRLVRNRVVKKNQNVNDNKKARLKSASETFNVARQIRKGALPERFNLLRDLRPSVAKKLSLTAQKDDDGGVEAHIYTGIHMLEDLEFDRTTGRASLPPSAFTQQSMQLKLPTNPYLRLK